MDYLLLSINWLKTTDALFPYQADWDGQKLQLRLNDFPEELMYSLLVNGEVQVSFDEWPSQWIR